MDVVVFRTLLEQEATRRLGEALRAHQGHTVGYMKQNAISFPTRETFATADRLKRRVEVGRNRVLRLWAEFSKY